MIKNFLPHNIQSGLTPVLKYSANHGLWFFFCPQFVRWSNWVTPFLRAFLSAFVPKLNCLNSIFSISSCKSTSAKPAGKFSTHIQIQLTNYHFSKLLNKNQTFIPAISKINPKYANAILGYVSSVKCCLSSNQLCCHLSTVTVWPQTLAHKKKKQKKMPTKSQEAQWSAGWSCPCPVWFK